MRESRHRCGSTHRKAAAQVPLPSGKHSLAYLAAQAGGARLLQWRSLMPSHLSAMQTAPGGKIGQIPIITKMNAIFLPGMTSIITPRPLTRCCSDV